MAPKLSTSTPRPDRLFDSKKLWEFDIDLSVVEVDHGDVIHVACDRSLPCSQCGRLPAHSNTLIIAVDGACRSNGRKNATPQSALGIFVGHSSPHNFHQKLPWALTNQVAELMAGWAGLMVASKVLMEDREDKLDTVIIKSDSEYLVKGMTDWILKWQVNGWKTATGKDVVNRDLFEDLLSKMKILESEGVKVLFWHARREFNGEADRLANLALDEKREKLLRVLEYDEDGVSICLLLMVLGGVLGDSTARLIGWRTWLLMVREGVTLY